jgi:cytochrome c oxidase subunit 1
LNEAITIAALIVGAVQVVFLYNLIWSYFNGKPSGGNPWRATTLEWQTPDTPPKHGNFGATLPVVYRWAYDYSVPGAADDFIPQNQPPAKKAGGLENTPDASELGPQAVTTSGIPKPIGG